MATPTQKLIELRIRQPVTTYINHKRDQGHGWRRIAEDLHTDTGIAISHTTIARWHTETTPT